MKRGNTTCGLSSIDKEPESPKDTSIDFSIYRFYITMRENSFFLDSLFLPLGPKLLQPEEWFS